MGSDHVLEQATEWAQEVGIGEDDGERGERERVLRGGIEVGGGPVEEVQEEFGGNGVVMGGERKERGDGIGSEVVGDGGGGEEGFP